MDIPLVAFCLGLLACGLSVGQVAGPVKLHLHPAGVPSPALRYQLAPPLTEMRDEDAQPHYMAAVERLEGLQKGPLGELLDRDGLNDADRERLVGLFAPVLSELRLASRCTECKWKHRVREEGFRAKLPYLAHMRWMATCVAATVHHHASKGEFEAAIATLQVGFAMARHLENDAVLVQALVATGLNRQMLDELEYFIQQPGAPNLYWAISTMPRPMRDMRSVMEWERGSMEFTFPVLRDPMTMTHEQWNDVHRQLAEMDIQNDPEAKLEQAADDALLPVAMQGLIGSGMSEEQIAAMEPWRANAVYEVTEYRRLESEVWKVWLLPAPQLAEEFPRAIEEIRASRNSGVRGLLLCIPSIQGTRTAIDLAQRRIELLRVVEAVRAEGAIPERLADLTLPAPDDPVTVAAFEYKRDGAEGVVELPRDGRLGTVTYRISLEP